MLLFARSRVALPLGREQARSSYGPRKAGCARPLGQQRRQPSQPDCRGRPHLRLAQAAPSSQATPEATCMEDQYDWLASHALQLAQARGPGSRLLVGIAGGPGSGKSTMAKEVCRRINAAVGAELAVVVPMDGYHYYKRQLQQFEDPAAAFARRGAHWTFDAAAFVGCIRRIRETGQAHVPSFDHGVGDPVDGDIQVTPAHRVVLAEGNYLLLDLEPWSELQSLFDETWFVDCDTDEAMQRVFERQTGHGVEPEVSRGRIAGNDRPNAELIAGTAGRASRVLPSIPFRDGPPAGASSDSDW